MLKMLLIHHSLTSQTCEHNGHEQSLGVNLVWWVFPLIPPLLLISLSHTQTSLSILLFILHNQPQVSQKGLTFTAENKKEVISRWFIFSLYLFLQIWLNSLKQSGAALEYRMHIRVWCFLQVQTETLWFQSSKAFWIKCSFVTLLHRFLHPFFTALVLFQ